jgi:hypothetical protein
VKDYNLKSGCGLTQKYLYIVLKSNWIHNNHIKEQQNAPSVDVSFSDSSSITLDVCKYAFKNNPFLLDTTKWCPKLPRPKTLLMPFGNLTRSVLLNLTRTLILYSFVGVFFQNWARSWQPKKQKNSLKQFFWCSW